ncbi:PNGase F N-terminal domain-containing protein [Chitinophaga tropicalis]|nr:PNGase F N-terminal domain-containing protein [Chitinophaga tropicalis]
MRKAMMIMALLATAAVQAQTKKGAVITYGVRYNGKEIPGAGVKMIVQGNKARLQPLGNTQQKERQFLDMKEKATYQVMTTEAGNTFTLKKAFSSYEKPELLPGTDTILGYPCKKAKVIIRSNTIEVWYTDALALKGTPTLSVVPGLGLVLKIMRNGNSETFATNISMQDVTDADLQWPANKGQLVDDAAYMQQIIESRYTTLPVFNGEQLSFGNAISNPPADQENVTYHYAAGTVILKKVKLPAVKPGTTLFAELTQYSNGDAYDRTGSVFMVPQDKKISFLNGLRDGVKALPVYKEKYQGVISTDDYLPTLELMRFFTPFGVHKYNEQVKIKGYNWADSAVFRQDITELLPRLEGEVWLGVFIGNYDGGGHKVSLRLKYYPGDSREEQKKAANWLMPVFNTTNLMEMAQQEYGTMFDNDSLTVTVNIPEGVKNLQLRYISTGHGGWGGGDEFNPKLNEIFVDGKRVYHFIPWRTDCGNFRLLNPASGNFGNGLSSSDLSRSNWCPGSVTGPVSIPLPDLTPGVHTFKVAIPLGKREGTSFSAWNVSGCLIGEK